MNDPRTTLMRMWTAGEDTTLEAMVAAGKTEKEIAAVIGRSQKAINIRKWKLGLLSPGDTYIITSPAGERVESGNLNAFSQEQFGGGRHSTESEGLRWAMRTGRKWKGWSVKRV